MKIRLLPALLLTLLLLNSCLPAANAQLTEMPSARRGDGQPMTEAEVKADAARAELEHKALGLLDDALAEATGLKLVENRVRAQLAAARLLWPRDAKAAREVFNAAVEGLAALNATVDPEDQQFYNAAQPVMQLRGEMLQLVGQYDPKLAIEFLRATRPPYAEALVAAGYGQQEQMYELSLAGQIAAQEPRRALEMAEESMDRGVTMGLVSVLGGLRTKEPAAAAKLAAAMVRKLRAGDLPNNYEASGVASQLLQMTRPVENAAANSTGPAQAAAVVPLLDEPTRRELVEKVLAALTNSVPNQQGSYNLFQALQTLLPEVEKYAPGRAAALRRRADELERSLNPQGRVMRPYDEVMQTGTVEALLDAAAKAPAEVRDALYMNASWKAYNEGHDEERARQILENVSNPQQRAQARRNMEQQTHMRAAQQGNYAEARQSIARMTSVQDRIMALLQVAERAAAAGDRQAARQMLGDALALAEGQMRGQEQFNYRLQIARAYAPLDTDASFEVIESAIGRLDELIEAASLVDGFGQDSFREGELREQGGYVWQDLIRKCAFTLATLALSDFERASADAKKFRRPETRTTAQLTLAASILNTRGPVRRDRYREIVPLITSGKVDY